MITVAGTRGGPYLTKRLHRSRASARLKGRGVFGAKSARTHAYCKFTDEKQDLWGRMWGRIFINTSTILILNVKFRINGGPRRIRTPDPLIRSQVLYPAELSVHTEGIKVCNALMQEQM